MNYYLYSLLACAGSIAMGFFMHWLYQRTGKKGHVFFWQIATLLTSGLPACIAFEWFHYQNRVTK